jgi:hypothetical protein
LSNLPIYEIAEGNSAKKLLTTDQRYSELKENGYVKGDFPTTSELNAYLNNFSNKLKEIGNSSPPIQVIGHELKSDSLGYSLKFKSTLFNMFKSVSGGYSYNNSISVTVPNEVTIPVYESPNFVVFSNSNQTGGFHAYTVPPKYWNVFAIGEKDNNTIKNIKYIYDSIPSGENAKAKYSSVMNPVSELYIRRIGSFSMSAGGGSMGSGRIADFVMYNNNVVLKSAAPIERTIANKTIDAVESWVVEVSEIESILPVHAKNITYNAEFSALRDMPMGINGRFFEMFLWVNPSNKHYFVHYGDASPHNKYSTSFNFILPNISNFYFRANSSPSQPTESVTFLELEAEIYPLSYVDNLE